jgi:hypothetical protein
VRRHSPISIVVLVTLAVSLVGCAEAVAPTTTPSPTASEPAVTPSATLSPTPPPSPTPTPAPTPLPLLGLRLEVVAKGLQNPVDVKARPDDGSLWVIEQRGIVRRIENGQVADEPVLDLRDAVNDFSIEQGLLGFAFHPNYPSDPRVFLFHSKANNDNVLASFETRGDPNVLDPKSRKDLLVINKAPDAVRHNGGTVSFGPDGLLYLSVGDAAQARLNGQDPANLPGSILRIDVDGGDPYAIPAGNPFGPGGQAPNDLDGAPEVWWFGLRNPWRFSIDEPTGLAYIGDVGQERVEEIDVVPVADGGLNFGWPVFEGTRRYSDVRAVSDLTDPVVEVRHGAADGGCSITGGEVYRGAAIPELVGHYFYADWCRGWIRSFRFVEGKVVDRADWSADLKAGMVSSFGHDSDGELLVLDWEADTVSRIGPRRQAP